MHRPGSRLDHLGEMGDFSYSSELNLCYLPLGH